MDPEIVSRKMHRERDAERSAKIRKQEVAEPSDNDDLAIVTE